MIVLPIWIFLVCMCCQSIKTNLMNNLSLKPVRVCDMPVTIVILNRDVLESNTIYMFSFQRGLVDI